MKKILNFVFILFSGILLATLSMTLVYSLPKSRMERNVRSSINVFYTENVYPQQAQGYKSSQLDNETEAIMLLGAIYDGGDYSPLEQAMRVARIAFKDTHACCVDLIQYLWEYKIPDNIAEYTRYWHGYMLYLKPLLLFMDYADIRMLNMMIQVILLLILIKELLDKQLKQFLFPFAMSLILLNPAAAAMSLQFSSIYYLVLISMILILRNHEKWRSKKRYPYVFFILGILTVFFDFLTYPMAALCMPLILVLILEHQTNTKYWLETMKDIIIAGICFGIGYIGMWAGKWVVSSFILQENVIANALHQLTVHTGDTIIEGETITKTGAILRNIKVILKWPYVLTFGTYFIYSCFKPDWKNVKKSLFNILPVFCVAIVPFIWIFLTASHASWCYWYTYRGLMATVFGGFCILKMLPQKR